MSAGRQSRVVLYAVRRCTMYAGRLVTGCFCQLFLTCACLLNAVCSPILKLPTAHSTVSNAQYTKHRAQSPVPTVQYPLCTMHIVQYIIHNAHAPCTIHPVRSCPALNFTHFLYRICFALYCSYTNCRHSLSHIFCGLHKFFLEN